MKKPFLHSNINRRCVENYVDMLKKPRNLLKIGINCGNFRNVNRKARSAGDCKKCEIFRKWRKRRTMARRNKNLRKEESFYVHSHILNRRDPAQKEPENSRAPFRLRRKDEPWNKKKNSKQTARPRPAVRTAIWTTGSSERLKRSPASGKNTQKHPPFPPVPQTLQSTFFNGIITRKQSKNTFAKAFPRYRQQFDWRAYSFDEIYHPGRKSP